MGGSSHSLKSIAAPIGALPIGALLIGVLQLACVSSQGGARHPDQKSEIEFAEPTAEEQRSLEIFDELGRAIYRQDIAAAKATDAVLAMAQGNLDPRVRGWSAVETNAGHLVQFMAPSDASLLVPYEVEVSLAGAAKATALDPPAAASGEAELRFRARQTVIRHGFGACSDRYNFVVLPGPLLGERGLLVYALAATLDPDEIIVGGHHRFVVSDDGTAVLKEQPLSKGCMTLRRREDSVALIVSNLVMPLPNESHVFVSLLYRTPLFVVAGGKIWRIDPGGFQEKAQ